MLITIRRRWLLRLFGWGLYNGQPRKPDEYPDYVTANIKLWWFWLRHGIHAGKMDESALRNHVIEL